jgi:trans-2-enoyl-CoA reductase
MEIILDNLVEAKRQLDSTIHKLKETVKTLEGKENPNRYKSQITLAKRRIEAFELSVYLIEREIRDLGENS